MKVARRRSRMRRRDLCTFVDGVSRDDFCRAGGRERKRKERKGYFGGIGFALDDVQDADVAALFAGGGGDHSVFGLEEPSHDV